MNNPGYTDYATGIAVDGQGQAYVAGYTRSTEATFPVTVGPDLTYNGGKYDAFVAKVSADGSHLLYAGYLGGSSNDMAEGIAVDGQGQAYVAGYTYSEDLPVTVGPDLIADGYYGTDAFVAKVSADGSHLLYAGYLGGSGDEVAYGIAVDGQGQAYVAGSTNSMDFPVTVGPDLTLNGGGDAFVAKISADGSHLLYAGYLGGSRNLSGSTGIDYATGIAVDGQGQAYVTGYTTSTDFPVSGGPDLTHNGGGEDAFVAKVSADGSHLLYAGYLGGNNHDYATGIVVDGQGQAYVTGRTYSTEATFPVSGGPDLTFNGEPGYDYDAFVAKVADTDLALSMSATPNPVSIGQPLMYTLTVSNNGQIEVPDVVLADTLPAGVTFSSASSGCSYDQVKTVTCTIGVLTARASTGVKITVIPTAAGTLTNTAQVTSATVIDDDLANNQASVTTAVLTISLSPSNLAFGNQQVGTTSASQTVTLTNSGTATLTISSVTATGDFTQSNNCGVTLVAGANCSLNVTFTPTITGSRTGQLTVSSDAAGSPHKVDLSGTGTAPPKSFMLKVTKAGSGRGTVQSGDGKIDCGATCSANYPSGTKVTLKATADAESTFTGWSGACTGKGDCQVTLNTAKSVTATFKSFPLKVTKAGSGRGTVQSGDGKVDCGVTCSANYPSDIKVTLKATSDTDSTFTGWSGACTGKGDCQVTMNAAKSVTATFKSFPLKVTKAGSGLGTVQSGDGKIDCGATCSANYPSGTKVTLTATPTTGSSFSGWSGACTGKGTCQVIMTQARTVTASFKKP